MLSLLLAALPLLPAPASAQLSLFGLKNTLVQFALDQINVPGSLEITVEAVEEPGDGATDLVGVAVADSEGVWLRIGRVSMNWNPSRLTSGEVFVTKLTADDVQVLRQPVPGPPDDAADAPEAEGAEPLTWPRSPIAVTVEGLKLTRVHIAGGVLGPSPLAFDASGRFEDKGDVQAAALAMDRTDDVTGTIRFDYSRNFATDLLRLALNAQEAPGGVVAELAGLPPNAAAEVRLEGEAPIADWRADLLARIDDIGRLEGGIGVASLQPLSLSLDVRAAAQGQMQTAGGPWLADPVDLHADLTLGEDGVLDLRQLAVDSTFGKVRAAGSFDTVSGQIDATASVDVPQLGPPALAAGTINGIRFDGRLGGTPAQLETTGRFTIADVTTDALTANGIGLDGQVTLAGEALRFALQGRADGLTADRLDLARGKGVTLDLAGALEGENLTLARLQLDGPLIRGEADGTVALADETLALRYEVSVSDLAPVAAAYDANAAGALNSAGDVTGPFAAAAIKAATTLDGFAFDGQPIGNARLQHDFTLADAITGTLTLAAETRDYGPVRAAAGIRLAGDELTVEDLTANALGVRAAGAGPVTANLATGLAKGRLTWRAADLATVARLAGTPLAGQARGEIALEPTNERQDITLALTLENGHSGDTELALLTLSGSVRDALGPVPTVNITAHGEGVEAGRTSVGPVDLTMTGPLNRAGLKLTLAGIAPDGRAIGADAAATLDLLGQPLAVTVNALTARYDKHEARLLQPLKLTSGGGRTRADGLRLAVPGGELAGKLGLVGQRLQTALTASFSDLGPLAGIAGLPVESGRLEADIAYDSRAPASATLNFTELQLAELPGGRDAIDATIEAAWNGRQATVSAAISGGFGDPILADASLALRPSSEIAPTPRPQAPLAGHIRWSGRAERLWALVPAADHYLEGAVDVDLTISGTFAEPEIAGRSDITDGRYENLEAGTVLTRLNAKSSVGAGGSYKVTLETQDPSGAPVTGQVTVSGGRLDAAVNTREALLVRRNDVTALVTAAITAKGTLLRPDVAGDVLIDRAEVRLVHAMPPSIAELGDVRIKGAPQPRPKPPPEGRIGLDVRVHAPANIFVRGRGLDSEWKMDLAVTGTAAKPRVTGSIDRIRGQLSLLGKAFDLERGQVRFTNPVTIDPELDIAMLRSAEGIRGGIVISGPASAPSLDFVSTPALPRSEVMPRLLFNRSAQSLTPLEGLELASSIATLMDGSGGTLDRVRGAIGLDVLRVEDTGNGTGVTVGRNVAPGVFIGATQPVDGTSPSVRVEVEVLDEVVVESETGAQSGSSVGVKWKRDF